jgi:hypothetical protein
LTCSYAAEHGHLDCLTYAHENECPWDKFACSEAAKRGHLDCLTYLHEHGCPWDEFTCSEAAENGHLDCLKYAYENGCSLNKKKCLELAIEFDRNLIFYYIKNLEKSETDEISEDSKISLNCNICKVNKKCIVYEPCGHLLSCWSCAIKTEECSNCNKKIRNFFKIFFS